MKYPNYLTIRQNEYEELFELSREYYDKAVRELMLVDDFYDVLPDDIDLIKEMKRIVVSTLDIVGELKTCQFAYCYKKISDIEYSWMVFSILKKKYNESKFMAITHKFNYVLGKHS